MLERVWRKGNPLTLLVGMQTSTATMENSVDILKKLELELPYDPAIPLLSIHTEETRIERDTCTPMFTAALFIIARTWKQPRCPLADKWIRKLCSIYIMEYYSAFKENAFESVLMKWMKLEPIIQSEVSQKEKHQYSMLLLLSRFSCVRLCATPWTVAHQAPPSMGFSRQGYWSGVPLPSPPVQYNNAYIWNLERW